MAKSLTMKATKTPMKAMKAMKAKATRTMKAKTMKAMKAKSMKAMKAKETKAMKAKTVKAAKASPETEVAVVAEVARGSAGSAAPAREPMLFEDDAGTTKIEKWCGIACGPNNVWALTSIHATPGANGILEVEEHWKKLGRNR